jgi:hypothetical protein
MESNMPKLEINSIDRQLDMEPVSPLLYAMRDGLKITATRHCCCIGESALPQLTPALVERGFALTGKSLRSLTVRLYK